MKSIFPYIPAGFEPQLLNCQGCKADFAIPLAERHPHKLAHVRPRDFHPIHNNKYWRLLSLELTCPHCGVKTPLVLPGADHKATLPLFGDEAFREDPTQCVYVIALVGADRRLEPKVRETWRELKRAIAPQHEPDSWRLHMKELWKTSGGRRHPVVSPLTPQQRIAAGRAVAATFLDLRDEVFSFVTVYHAPTLRAKVKQQALLSLLGFTLDTLCPRGTAPKITLESDQLIDGRPGMSYGTAHALDEFQRSLLYTILSKGLPVDDIVIERASQSFWFELADFAAYVVARACQRRWRGVEPDLDPDTLGNVFWIGNQPSGNLVCQRRRGIPWEQFESRV